VSIVVELREGRKQVIPEQKLTMVGIEPKPVASIKDGERPVTRMDMPAKDSDRLELLLVAARAVTNDKHPPFVGSIARLVANVNGFR